MDRLLAVVDEHRRLVAAVLAGLAVLAALSSVRASPAGQDVLVARRDLVSGHVVAAGDVRTASVPPAAAPDHVLTVEQVVGRRVAGPMRAGEPMTDRRVVGPGPLAGYGDGAVLTTIRVDRADVAAVSVGDVVDVVGVAPGGEAPAQVVARAVEIATVPDDDRADVVALGVVTTEDGALALARAGLSSRLTVITASAG